MAIEKTDVGKVTVSGVRVTGNICKYLNGFEAVEAGQVAKAGQTVKAAGREFSSPAQATSWGKSAMAGAAVAVANILVRNIGLGKDAAQAASTALNTGYLIAFASSMTAIGFAISGIGAILSWAGVAGIFGAEPPRVYWNGRVNIFFNEKYPYRFSVSVQTIDQETVGDISDKVEKEFNKGPLDKINKALEKLPHRDVDFVLKYVVRPPDTMTMKVDAGRATSGVEDRFSKKLGQEMQRIVKEIQKSAVELSHLHFLASLKAKDLVKKKAIEQVPQTKYKAEGKWRKEEERLSIKLMQRREYARQIRMMLYAYFFNGIRKGSNYSGLARVEKPKQPENYRRKSNIEEGKSYVVGNIPAIDLFSTNLKKRIKEIWNENHANVPIGGAKIRVNFRIRPKLQNKQINLELFHIKGHITVPTGGENAETTELTNSLKDTLKGTIKFANHLIGEIPENAAKYIANNVGTTDAYMNILWGQFKPRRHVPFGPQPSQPKSYDFQINSNYSDQLNDQMQDIIDLYKNWQKGYGEAFKKTERTKILNNMLPQIRPSLRGNVTNLANSYADVPRAEAVSGLAIKTMKTIKRQYENAKNNVPQIKRNKSWIINHFGQKEYNRLLNQGQGRAQNLIIQYIDNAGDVASQEMYDQKMNYLTITQTEFENLVNRTYSKLSAKHPDVSVSKDKIRQRIKEKVNIKGEQPPKKQPSKEEPKKIPGPGEKPEEIPEVLSIIPSAEEIPKWFDNLSTPAKVSIIGSGVGILALLFLSKD